jgi:hypothetical protein
MAWYDRSELQRRLDEAEKQLDDIKDDGVPVSFLRRQEVQYLESYLRKLSMIEEMLWFGTMPSYFRCSHGYNTSRFDEYDFETGPNFWTIIEAKEPPYRRTHDCVCCHWCTGEIRDLHHQYRAYRHLDLDRLLPALIPPLHHIIRSYLVPETS